MNTFYLVYTTHFGEYGSEGIKNNRLFETKQKAINVLRELSKDYSNPLLEEDNDGYTYAANIVDGDYTELGYIVDVKIGEGFPIYTQSPGGKS